MKHRNSFATIFFFSAAVVLLSISFAGSSGAASSDYRVTSKTTLTAAGGRVEWGPSGDWIYYDRRQSDDYYYDVHRVRPDGTEDTCLTCSHPDLPNRHQGQPAVHPSGRWLLFQVEKASHYEEEWDYNPCKPGGGYFSDLYVMDLESEPPYTVYPLTDVSSVFYPPGGSLHSHFSGDGSRVLWGDLEGFGGRFGDWRIAVADFKTDTYPHLENHSYYNPGDNPFWFETHDWIPGDSAILLSAAPLPGMDGFAGDICRMDFSDPSRVERLTWTSGTEGEPGEWDEHAHLSPLNDAVSWISSQGYGIHPEDPDWRSWLVTDLWLMNPDGSAKKQITFFNHPSHPDYIPGEIVCADNSWSPDGLHLAVAVYRRSTGATTVKIIHFTRRIHVDSSDFNGDGTADVGVFRPETGFWGIRGVTRLYFGRGGDLPVSGDYDGDGTTDIGIFRSDSALWAIRGVTRTYFGSAGDTPLPVSFDPAQPCSPGIFRDSIGLWAIRGLTRFYFGRSGDVPLPGDYDGDGRKEIAVFRQSTGLWAIKDSSRFYFGAESDEPVPADYRGDGKHIPAVFRPSSGLWAIRGYSRYYFGEESDTPLAGDFNGNSFDDAAIFRSDIGLWAIRGLSRVYFGASGDIPVTR